ncbi:MAG: hypothetical protein GTN89_12670 [Acidobacteria bacterium]|nr:hypothetical protein [Acidobacteriota bacterium]NIM63859.1 hypothetical protein [Acidobacteriota bacterium]NIO60128.1 hypothetical protein [Acidobacteriota bacterium]NIQ31192.1 hypothetical protein [Acidobacteriota bacterium]NIQ86329.1 hypothetical protein [Acidobacteriota bacterium]
MKTGLKGAIAGLIVGLIFGTALFGPIGGVVGVILGSLLGFAIMTPLTVAYVRQAARQPLVVECPETHTNMRVTLDPDKAAKAELWNRKQKIETCSRFGGPPDCDEACAKDLEI